MNSKSSKDTIDYPVYNISPETSAKFAMIEELRLVSSKLDRFYNEIISTLSSDAQYRKHYDELVDATKEIKKARKKLRKEYQCPKKKNGNSKNQKKISTGSTSQPKSN